MNQSTRISDEDLKIRVLVGEEAKQLARRLMKRAPGLRCRVCEGRDFALLEQPDMDYRTTLVREPLAQSAGEVVRQKLLTLLCTNCGHLEQFAEAVVNGAEPYAYGDVVADD